MEYPTDVLVAEHRVIERVLDALEAHVAGTKGQPFSRAFYDEALDFFANFADAIHHGKEEDELFPMMNACGMPRLGGPIGCMLHEHDEGRAYLRAVRENLAAAAGQDAEAIGAVTRAAASYIGMLRQHIQKEDTILFQMAENLMTPGDREALTARFDERLAATASDRARYEAFAARAGDLAAAA